MKICVLGDIHGLKSWRVIVATERENVDRFIFLGDYVDDKAHGSTPEQQADNLRDILNFANEFQAVDLLVGNHDMQYAGGSKCNTPSTELEVLVHDMIVQGIEKGTLKVSVQYGKYLFSHAGVSREWMNLHGIKDTSEINNLFRENIELVNLQTINGISSEDNIFQSPLWIRAKNGLYKSPLPNLTQVVGHTRKTSIEITEQPNSRYIFTDTQLAEYIIIDTNRNTEKIHQTTTIV